MIYVVIGTVGEYSDRKEWCVCAYSDEALARLHVESASREVKRIEATHFVGAHPVCDEAAKIWDAEMQFYYFGPTYYVSAIPLLTALPIVT